MKGKILLILAGIVCWLGSPTRAIAVTDPMASINNKIGIHVLDPGEIGSAARLVNNDGKASWGYVTVPIQATDRDRKKWGQFMKAAAELKVIPIIRVATVVGGSNWEVPNNFDLVDFANFLDGLEWPTKNRYVIIFNEVNRSDEYGGAVSPEHYAQILVNAIRIFKDRNQDFFILPAGLDNAARSTNGSIFWRDYLTRMFQQEAEVFNSIDGWNSHAYPNPGMAGRVNDNSDQSIRSYQADLKWLNRFTRKKLPVFITETGWNTAAVSENTAAINLANAYWQAWSEPQVVAITPFLLQAGAGPFVPFSFVNNDGSPRSTYVAWQGLATVNGSPELAPFELEPAKAVTTNSPPLPELEFQGVLMTRSSLQKLERWLASWFSIKGWN